MSDLALKEVERTEIAHTQSPSIEMMSIIAQAARDPNIDTDKMQALFAMKREEEDRDAKKAFNRAFVAAKKDIKPIVRNLYNKQTKSKYADLMVIADQVDPVLERYGLAITYGTAPCERDGYYTMIADLLHEDGHEKRYSADIPIDTVGIKGTRNKTDTHAFGSTTTYGRRYMKMMIFDIATKDDDGNAAGRKAADVPKVSDEQIIEIRNLIQCIGRTEDQYVQWQNAGGYEIESLADIPAKDFDAVVSQLKGMAK